MALSSSSAGSVPPGFRFHPTDEELLLYYLKKKISFEKFELEVIREVDLNKTEPWDLQERCKIGSTPQNEWYFFSHKDRKYPTGSRTNRATFAGFWKATGRDKCIRTSYKKIGMRKTLVFYRGRAPHGQKTDWIMHEYRLEEYSDDTQGQDASEDGWVVCRVFKKKCFFKISGNGDGERSLSQGTEDHIINSGDSHGQPRALSSHYIHPNLNHHLHHHHHQTPNLYYSHMPTSSYSHVQVQDLLTNHRPSSTAGYDFPVLPNDSANIEVGACEGMQHVGGPTTGESRGNEWVVLDGMDGRFSTTGAATAMQQMSQLPVQQRGGEMDLWGYGK